MPRNPLRRLHPLEALGNAPARAGEIRVERIEARLSPRVPFPHRHDFYHYLFLEKGGGWHEVDFERHRVAPAQLYQVLPGQVHAWELSSTTRGFVLEFTRSSLPPGPRIDSLLRSLEAVPAVTKGDPSVLALMLAEFREKNAGYQGVLENLLLAFLARLSREAGAIPARAAGGEVARFRDLVEANYREHHDVEFYAANLGLTAKALTTRVSRSLGKSAGAVIQERCLAEAKRLLAYSEMAVAEIGYEIGFDDPNYFARFFRQRAGMPPGKFRRLSTRSVPG